MLYAPAPKVVELRQKLLRFMDECIYPNEKRFNDETKIHGWNPHPLMEELKAEARKRGLWNVFLP